jgi:hypothetical protein
VNKDGKKLSNFIQNLYKITAYFLNQILWKTDGIFVLLNVLTKESSSGSAL